MINKKCGAIALANGSVSSNANYNIQNHINQVIINCINPALPQSKKLNKTKGKIND